MRRLFFKGNKAKGTEAQISPFSCFTGGLRLLMILLISQLSYLISTPQAKAQTISLNLSAHPNKEVILLAAQGIRKDTIQKITLDDKGVGIFDLKNKNQKPGLMAIAIKPDVSFDFVFSPKEQMTIVGKENYVHKQNAKILNSTENQTLDRWYLNTYLAQQKLGLNQELSKLYAPKTPLHIALATEKTKIEGVQKILKDSIKNSISFAGKYMQFKADTEQKLPEVWKSDSTRNIARAYFQTLDFETLHTTGQWFSIINTCSEAYQEKRNLAQKFGVDVVANLKRIKSLPVYTDLADAAISICESYAWTYDQDNIVDFLVADNRLHFDKLTSSKLKKVMQLQRLQVGNKAPDLLITKHIETANRIGEPSHQHEVEILPTDQLLAKKTLLVFHESGCGNCDKALKELSEQYEDLTKKGIRVISIAADQDEAIFKKTAATLPWADKYCDLNGFKGVNFKNYAIIGTPTIFLLDDKGIIQSKGATASFGQ